MCKHTEMLRINLSIYVSFIFHSIFIIAENSLFLPNYGWRCSFCICKATLGGCDLKLPCEKGYCGPYRISQLYWTDGGNVTLPADDPERAGWGAYQECSLDYECSQKILLGYFQRYARDCNGDGVTNCDDYAMLHFNGRALCQLRMDRNELSRNWWKNYTECDPLDSKKFEFY